MSRKRALLTSGSAAALMIQRLRPVSKMSAPEPTAFTPTASFIMGDRKVFPVDPSGWVTIDLPGLSNGVYKITNISSTGLAG